MKFINYLIILLIFISLVLIGYTQLPTGLVIDPIEDNEIGLVALWHMNEGSGSTVIDSSGNGNSGTANGATWVDGKFSKALQFDGINDYIQISSIPELNEFTLEGWVNYISLTSYPNSSGIIRRGSWGQKGFTFFLREDGYLYFTTFGNGSYNSMRIGKGQSFWIDTWHHIIATYKNGIGKIYIDGTLENNESMTNYEPQSGIAYIAYIPSSGNPDKYANSIFDEMAIYNRELSASEIQNHYDKGMGEEPPPPSPPECGNNIQETGEECDGTDDSACPGNCLSNCTCYVAPPEEPPEPSGNLTWLHVDGKYIKNEYNQIVYLRGAAFPDLSFQTFWGSWFGEGWDSFVRLSEGKANVIRVTMSHSPWQEPDPWPGSDPSVYDAAVEQIVALAERDNIYLILDFHGGLTWNESCELAQNATPLIDWWMHWVNKYKDNPVVGYEIYNEPWLDAFACGQGSQAGVNNWANVATQVVQAIDAVNPKALIIVSSVPFSQPMQYWLDNPLPYNVVYGWDQYYRGWDEWHKQPYRDGDWDLAYNRAYDMLYNYGPGKAAEEYNLPVLGFEFGWVPTTPDLDPAWNVSMHHWLSILNEWETHWYYWYFPYSSSGGSVLSSNISELGPAGEIWAQYLNGTRPDEPPPTPSGNLTRLHIDGKYVKNEYGQKVFLRGAAIGELAWRTSWSGDIGYRVDQMSKLTDGRANIIRIAITPNPSTTIPGELYPWNANLVDVENNIWETEIHPEIYAEEVDELVAAAAKNKMYVSIDFHGGFCSNTQLYGSCTGSNSYTSYLALNPQPWIDWHLYWINRYKDNPVVTGVELWNEPYDAAFGYGNNALGQQRFYAMEEQAVQQIHQASSDAIIMVASAPYASIAQHWIDNPLPGNIMYAWDTYYYHWADYWKEEYAAGNWAGGYAKTLDKLNRYHIGTAVNAGMPVIATEFGWNWDASREPGYEHQMADMLSIMNDWETHWHIWWWWDSTNYGLANPGYNSLREYGQVWAQHLNGTRPGEPIPPEEPSPCQENWICTAWSDCINDIQTRTCTDSNNCGTTIYKPSEIQDCESCIESWLCSDWSECIDSLQTRNCSDQNDCGTLEYKPNESQVCEESIIPLITPAAPSYYSGVSAGGAAGPGGLALSGGKIETETKLEVKTFGPMSFDYDLPIHRIDLTPLVDITSSKIIVEDKGTITPKQMTPPNAIVYGYFNLTNVNIQKDDVSDIKISFKVEQSFYEIYDLDISQTKLMRYNSTSQKWNELSTQKVSTLGDYHYFESTPNELSFYAITTLPVGAIGLGLPLTWIIVGIAIVIFIILITRRR